MKQCTHCKEYKNELDFGKYKRGKDGLRSTCKECTAILAKKYYNNNKDKCNEAGKQWRINNPDYWRKQDLKRNYGISVEEYDTMFKQQKGVCAICGAEPTNIRLAVDHCHNSKEVRGLLCSSCNTGIGHLKHDAYLLEQAIKYLNA